MEDPQEEILTSDREIVDTLMEMAHMWAQARSKDPGTRVGAVIYDPSSGGMYFGYNGFPPAFPDYAKWWRNRDPANGPTKYDFVVHAEKNAVRKAFEGGADLHQSIMVVTHHPCPACMRDVIAPSGIKTVYYRTDEYSSFNERAREICDIIISNTPGLSVIQVKETFDA